MTRLTKITISPATILEIEADELTPETQGILAHVRSLDISMPEMEDNIDLEHSYEWIQHVNLSGVYELRIHSYCKWWCARAGLVLNGLIGSDIDKLVLDVYHVCPPHPLSFKTSLHTIIFTYGDSHFSSVRLSELFL